MNEEFESDEECERFRRSRGELVRGRGVVPLAASASERLRLRCAAARVAPGGCCEGGDF
jgi:hypothetical protein